VTVGRIAKRLWRGALVRLSDNSTAVEVVMLRITATALAIALCSPAMAQVGQFPGVPGPTPAPGAPMVAPLPPSAPLPIPPPNVGAPSNLMRGTGVPPANVGAPSNLVQVPGFPPVHVPSGRRNRNSFSDRVERCIHAGTAAGIGPNDIGAFSRQCAQ
jgi:hypothetical protein